MPDANVENSLLTGMLAVQAGLITDEQLLGCFRQWMDEQANPLEELLLHKGCVTEEEYDRLKQLVAEHRAACDSDLFKGIHGNESLTVSLQGVLNDRDLAARLRPMETRTDAPSSAASEHRRIGPFKLLSPLGEGGMGTVYVAEQESPVRRRVALKVIKKGMDSAQILARFEAERQALALMDHHNIAKVFDTGETEDGRPYFAMELVKGISITDYCDRNRLSLVERLNLFVDVCRAIQHAHQKGIIHRDIKPSNLLVQSTDEKAVPKVIDFGLAKALEQNLTDRTVFTQFGQVVGTLEYMSPEQAQMNALDVDTRSDIYSLGVVLYELLTGSTPLQRANLKERQLDQVLALIRDSDPPRPSSRISESGEIDSISAHRKIHPHRLSQLVKGDLDWIVMKALEKDRTRRYETANGFANDIIRYLNDEPVMATPPSAGYRFRKFARRNKKMLAGVVAVTLVLTTATIVSTVFAGWALKERTEAKLSAEKAQISAGKFKAINDFIINDLLGAARPEGEGLGVDATLKEALDQAADKIQTAFADQPEIEAEVRMTLGQSYLELGAFEDAEQHLTESLRLRRVLFGEDHEDTLRSRLNYGRLLFSQSKYEESESCYRNVFAGFTKVYGSDNSKTLDARRGIARALNEQGKYREAEPILRETLETCLSVLGPDDNATLNARNELAFTLWDLGELEEPEEMFRVNLEKRTALQGKRHPETLVSINNLASILDYQNKLDEAEKLFNECYALRKQVFGEDHAKTVSVLNNLAILNYRRGKLVEAENQMRKVIEMQKKLRGVEHAHTLRSMLTLAAFLEKQKKSAEAEKVTLETLKIQKKVLGERHPDTLVTMNNLAQILRGQKKFERAADLHRDVLTIRREDKARWQDLGVSLSGLANTLLYQDLTEDAEPLFREYVELSRANLPHAKTDLAGASKKLGVCLVRQKKFKEAEEILLECYQMIENDKKFSDAARNGVADQVVTLYESWEKPEEAERWRAKRTDDK